jgi:hypothetical protein
VWVGAQTAKLRQSVEAQARRAEGRSRKALKHQKKLRNGMERLEALALLGVPPHVRPTPDLLERALRGRTEVYDLGE